MKPPKSIMPKAVRDARIESIRNELAKGTYRIESGALAQALIEHMQQKHRRAA